MTTSQGPRLKAVLFDNNGTALDDLETVAYPSMKAIFARYELPAPTLAQYRAGIGSDWFPLYQRYGFDLLPEVTPADIDKMREEFYEEHHGEAHFRDGFELCLIQCLRWRLKLGMVSAEIDRVLRGCLARAHLIGYLHPDIWAGARPKTPSLVRALVTLQALPEEAVYVDDTVDGIQAAQGIGMRTIGFANPTSYNDEARIRAAKPTAVAHDFDEVRAIVHSWV